MHGGAHGAAGIAVTDDARTEVSADESTNIKSSRNGSRRMAVADRPVVHSYKPAHKVATIDREVGQANVLYPS